MSQKHTKSEVDYGPGMAERHCSICEHFEKPDACEKVKGSIDPAAWCKLFEKK